jgi:hypothetical protein
LLRSTGLEEVVRVARSLCRPGSPIVVAIIPYCDSNATRTPVAFLGCSCCGSVRNVCDAVVGKEHASMDSACTPWTPWPACLFSWTICSLSCFWGVTTHPLKMEHLYRFLSPSNRRRSANSSWPFRKAIDWAGSPRRNNACSTWARNSSHLPARSCRKYS